MIDTPDLYACQVLIDTQNHDFMRSDSWIDCSQPFGYPLDWIEAALFDNPRLYLGRVSDVTRRDILNCVYNTPLLSPRKKQPILAALDP